MNKKIKMVLVSGALVLQAGHAQSGLIISEYVEGNSYNKALELYNTGAAIDLSGDNYVLDIYSNGNTSPRSIDLVGSVRAGETFVITHPRASTDLFLLADQVAGLLGFNGDDSMVLRQAGTILDSFGRVGTDPGLGWGVGNSFTANNTLRRLADSFIADVDVQDMFEPERQWTGFGVDNFSDLGQYTYTAAELQGASEQSGAVSVPEPGTVLLLLMGLAGLLLSGTRKGIRSFNLRPEMSALV